MQNYFSIDQGDVKISPGVKILKGDIFNQLASSRDLLQKTRMQRDQIIKKAKECYEVEKVRGYEDGFNQAKKELTDKIIANTKEFSEYKSNIEKSINNIVLSVISKILGEFEEHELIYRSIKKILEDYNKNNKLTIFVRPEVFDNVEKKIKELVVGHPVVEFIEVCPDYKVNKNECIIDTTSEVVIVNLNDQISALSEMMKNINHKK